MASSAENTTQAPGSAFPDGPLLELSKDQAAGFGQRTITGNHSFHLAPQFTDAGLIDFLDNFPRERLQMFTMGKDQLHREEWKPVDTLGASGQDLWEITQRGRFWMNIFRLHDFDSAYKDMLEQMFDELKSKCPTFNPLKKTLTCIISAPEALVYYHADPQANVLWQIRGSKRVWVYPANDRELVGQDFMEDIFASYADEEVPYDPSFDEKATAYDVNPGELITWPLNAPHRVSNHDSVNISLSTPFETEESDIRKTLYCANRLLRRSWHLPARSVKEHGLMADAKRFAFRAWRKAGLLETPPRRGYVTDLRVDPASPRGCSEIESGSVVTEFSSYQYKLGKDLDGSAIAIPKKSGV